VLEGGEAKHKISASQSLSIYKHPAWNSAYYSGHMIVVISSLSAIDNVTRRFRFLAASLSASVVLGTSVQTPLNVKKGHLDRFVLDESKRERMQKLNCLSYRERRR